MTQITEWSRHRSRASGTGGSRGSINALQALSPSRHLLVPDLSLLWLHFTDTCFPGNGEDGCPHPEVKERGISFF